MKLCLIVPLFAVACAGASSPSAIEISAYGIEQFDCVDQADARTSADACRAASRMAFCRKYPTMPNCTDGGAP